jgi:M6 family metalloprotease-like protein
MQHVTAWRPSRRIIASLSTCLLALAAALSSSSSVAVASSVKARFVTSRGWVAPDEGYTFTVKYVATDANSATLTVRLPAPASFVSSTPSPTSSAGGVLTYSGLAHTAGQIVINAKAKTLAQDPEIIWKNLSATAELLADGTTLTSMTNGPRVTQLESAKFGDRPFPVVNVQYADIGHCVGAGTPVPECVRDHPVSELDAVMNSRDPTRTSVWQHYNDMSLGQLNPQGTVSAAGKTTVPFTGIGQHKFARFAPAGTCEGVTRAGPAQPQGSGVDAAGSGGADGTPTYPNRIENGWYVLPGQQTYYGSDKYGHGLVGALGGVGAVFGIDDGCGPTGKLAYDAASVADPDVDYNEFDSDRDGLVDFFEVIFAGVGGNGSTDPSGLNNVWPHSSSLEFYFIDANGEKGYVSNDQLRDLQERPLWWTDSTRTTLTTTDKGAALKAYVRVGRYNVNPETSFDKSSVISHEYGHSLGLPDFYSLGTRGTFGTWELMAEDHSQYMTGYSRQYLGWIVPKALHDGEFTLRESKYDTHSITWYRPDGTLYELTGPDVHNVDLYRVGMPNEPLIDTVPDGTRAMFSGAGNDFGCPPDKGHGLAIALPELESNFSDATAITLKFKTKYEMEWDYDYGFVLVGVANAGGVTWTSLPSKNGTTGTKAFNPSASTCLTTHDNGITGVSGDPNATQDRAQGVYPKAEWIDDEYDLTAYKGKSIVVLLSYATDPGLAKKGWFVDQLQITVTRPSGTVTLVDSSFEKATEATDGQRFGPLGSGGWNPLSTADGGTADHAYYLELRDRLAWDFDGRGQDDRGAGPSWQPGISLLYTQESKGFGNIDGANPPHQTPVDSVPEPGSETPNLDDAAFTLQRNKFNGCTHVDNYEDPDAEDGFWHMPASLAFTVTEVNALNGLSTLGVMPGTPATAKIIADVNPDCSIVLTAPELTAAAYENPDTDGAYTLNWTRPAGATGPDTLQEATLLATLFSDDAEGGLGKWVTTSQGTGSFPWEASTTKAESGNSSFWARYTNGSDNANLGNVPVSLLTLKDPLDVPATGTTTFSFYDFMILEGDDLGIVEITADGGTTWEVLSGRTNTLDPLNPDPGIATEPMAKHEFSLDAYKGKSVKIRFRLQSGGDDRPASNPIGWYVDDIRIDTNNFADILTTPATSAAFSNKPAGTYYYRVRTAYPAGPVTVPGPWSDAVTIVNNFAGTGTGQPVTGGSSGLPSPAEVGNTRLGGAFPLGGLVLLALVGLLRRRR